MVVVVVVVRNTGKLVVDVLNGKNVGLGIICFWITPEKPVINENIILKWFDFLF